jgi:hypothetical protein
MATCAARRTQAAHRARRETAIDLVLAAPDLDDLLADPKVPGDLTHLAPGIDQVHDAPAKLC